MKVCFVHRAGKMDTAKFKSQVRRRYTRLPATYKALPQKRVLQYEDETKRTSEEKETISSLMGKL